MPREGSLQVSVQRFLDAQPFTTHRKLHGTGYGFVGDPDIYGCHQGRMFLLELKRPGQEPRSEQRLRLQEWRRAGAATAVIHDLDELQTFWQAFTNHQNGGILIQEETTPAEDDG